jgi:hypothetical protein
MAREKTSPRPLAATRRPPQPRTAKGQHHAYAAALKGVALRGGNVARGAHAKDALDLAGDGLHLVAVARLRVVAREVVVVRQLDNKRQAAVPEGLGAWQAVDVQGGHARSLQQRAQAENVRHARLAHANVVCGRGVGLRVAGAGHAGVPRAVVAAGVHRGARSVHNPALHLVLVPGQAQRGRGGGVVNAQRVALCVWDPVRGLGPRAVPALSLSGVGDGSAVDSVHAGRIAVGRCLLVLDHARGEEEGVHLQRVGYLPHAVRGLAHVAGHGHAAGKGKRPQGRTRRGWEDCVLARVAVIGGRRVVGGSWGAVGLRQAQRR